MKKKWLIALTLTIVFLTAAWWLLFHMSLSALAEPSSFETAAATKVKRFLVHRAADAVPPQPARDEASVAIGGMQFRADCAVCHGSDGRTPTEIGRSMSPRAPDLGSPEVQAWSDAELFWIIKNGIKLTGMPGFGRQHDDARVWQLVRFVRETARQPALPAH